MGPTERLLTGKVLAGIVLGNPQSLTSLGGIGSSNGDLDCTMPIRVMVEADEPLLLFSSTSAARDYIEPIDVVDGVYKRAYTNSGGVLEISVKSGNVELELLPETVDQSFLRSLLTSLLHRAGVQFDSSEDFYSILQRCEKYTIL